MRSLPSETPPSSREWLAWGVIRENILLARSFTEEVTAERFASDRKTFYAVVRCLEIISEAARRLRGPQQQAYPDLEWRQIEASGNVFRHDYDNVAEYQVWTTTQTRLSVVLRAAEDALSGEPPPGCEPK
jgi:uncharacterized protein with HEPN domain